MKYVINTVTSIFIIGLLIFAILSVIGLVYLTQMAYSDKRQDDGQYCGDTNTTERNIARLAVIVLWFQMAWIIVGSYLQSVWNK
jgi:hypothetical protein